MPPCWHAAASRAARSVANARASSPAAGPEPRPSPARRPARDRPRAAFPLERAGRRPTSARPATRCCAVRGGGRSLHPTTATSLLVFLQGHPEYDADSLAREYRRDVGRYLDGTRADYPAMPENCFTAGGHRAVRRLRSAGRPPGAIRPCRPQFPNLAETLPAQAPWQADAARLFRNWLGYVARKRAISRHPHRGVRPMPASSPLAASAQPSSTAGWIGALARTARIDAAARADLSAGHRRARRTIRAGPGADRHGTRPSAMPNSQHARTAMHAGPWPKASARVTRSRC